MTIAVFFIVLAVELLLAGSLLVSILWPEKRIWPPPSKSSWQFWWIWSLTISSLLGLFAIAALDWNTFVFVHWFRFVLGGSLFFGGSAFALWGVFTLSWHATAGLTAKLMTTGPYRYTRNPQYAGDFAVLLGIAVFSNSLLAMILSIMGIFCFCMAPLAEEPWLRQQYGGDYEAYCRTVPRFFGIRTKQKN
jgi:protein-S-isoprenylcysteine O-methyltransferase Ste14